MTNWILEPNNPDPNTQLSVPLLGWHFVVASMADLFAGANLVYQATGGANGGWYPDMHPVPGDTSNPPIWRLIFTKTGWPSVIVNDTDWFAFDGVMPRALTQEVVNSNYTATAQEA